MIEGMLTVVGRLGQEPERKTTPKGDVVEFSVAHNDRVQTPEGRWEDTPTTWYQVDAWGRLGANAALSLHKGQPVVVHGMLMIDEYVARDGQTVRRTKLRAKAIGHDLNNGTASFQKAGPAAPPTDQALEPAAETARPEQRPAAAAPAPPGDWGAPAPEPREPAPVGWSTTMAVDEAETPF